MNKEGLQSKDLLSPLFTLIAIAALSTAAFPSHIRKEIGRRDHWTCQGRHGRECVISFLNHDKPASFKDGFMVTAAHNDHDHKNKSKYYSPTNGRVLCVFDHALDELERGNEWGALKQLEMGVYTWSYLEENNKDQWYPTMMHLQQLLLTKPKFVEHTVFDHNELSAD
jgi:hypothetical protein